MHWIQILAIGALMGLVLGLLLPRHKAINVIFYDDARVDGSKLPENDRVDFIPVSHLYNRPISDAISGVRLK